MFSACRPAYVRSLARVTAALGAREVEGKGPRMIPISACIALWSAEIMTGLHARFHWQVQAGASLPTVEFLQGPNSFL